MSRSRLYSVLTHLHRTHQVEGLSDADLLARFAQLRDEAAFELLVWRHQRMVLGVCRRLLRDAHDADDAFQAAFLTLARKAPSIGRREAVASWLYKVAYRCALRVRQTVRRQQQGVVNGVDPANVAVVDSSLAAIEQDDLRESLDEEVQRLPAKYRAAVVLCYLEGKSYQQAAVELGCPAGTLSARLHKARERLRRRLTARGVAPAAALALLEGTGETHAAARLATVAVQAAGRILAGQSAADVVSSRTLEVATGVMQAMSAGKQKIIVIVLLMGCLSGLTGWAAWRVLPQAPKEQNAPSAGKPVSATKEGKAATWQECARLRGAVGRWRAVLFAPDGSALATFDGEDRLRVWNTSDWQLRWDYSCRERYGKHVYYDTSFSPDGRFLHVIGEVENLKQPGEGKAEVTLLDAASGRELARLPGQRLRYSPDKTMFAVCQQKDGVTLWDAQTLRKLRRLDRPASWVTFSKDASFLVIGNQVWDTATGKKRAEVEGFYPEISVDGETMSTLLPGGVVKVWDTANGKERFAVRKEGRKGCHASFSAHGKRLLIRSYMELTPDGVFANLLTNRKPKLIPPRRIRPIDVCLYDAATGDELQRLPGASDYDVHAEFSSDGRTVAYSRLEPDEVEREEVVLWDVESGRERTILHAPSGAQDSRSPSGLRNPFFSPDGTTLKTTDPFGKTLRLWDVATGRRVLDLPADVGMVYFSPDGQWLAGVTAFNDSPNSGPYDIRIFRCSDKALPPVVRGKAAKPSQPAPPPTRPEPPKSEARRAFDAVRQEAEKFAQETSPKFRDAKPGSERDLLQCQWNEANLRFGARFLKVARDYPDDPAALEALEHVLRTTGNSADGEMSKLRNEALGLILRDHRRSPELSNLIFRMSYQYAESAEKALADLAENSPHRPIRGRAAWRLAEALASRAEAARLVRALPELLDDPELADRKTRLERLQKIDADAVARMAEEWYVKVRDHYADVPANDVQKIRLDQYAESGLFALRNLALGKAAPDIEGEDLDDKHFHLNEYRGKVVVLIFCGHWCGPCRQMNPQKQQLVERYAGKPFALVEVNSDEDRETVKRIMRKEKLTWRCWFDGGREGPIARRWGISGWPRIFLLDGNGVIRYKELRGPILDRVVDRLLKESEPEPRP